MPKSIRPLYRCDACSFAGSITDFSVEYNRQCPVCTGFLDVVPGNYSNWDALASEFPWIGRYSGLIPVDPTLIAEVNEPSLQPVTAPKIAELLGVDEVNLIPQSMNPTGTFKDLEAAVIAAKSREWGLESVSVHSTGNTALSYRHFFSLARIPCASFIPTRCADKFIGVSKSASYPVYGFVGPFSKLSSAARQVAAEKGFLHLSPLHWKLEGKMSIAFAIAECIPQTSLIVQTIAGGYGPIAYAQGFQRAARSGLRVPNPGYGLFQPEDASTIAEAISGELAGLDISDLKLPDYPFEATLQSTNPLATFPQVRNIINSTSFVDSVPLDVVASEAQQLTSLCEDVGVPIDFEREKSPFISWAGLLLRAKKKLLPTTSSIAFVITGSSPPISETPVTFDYIIPDES